MTTKNNSLAGKIGLIIAVVAIMSAGGALRGPIMEKRTKAKQEQRANEFGKFVLQDTHETATDDTITVYRLAAFKKIYAENPQLFEQYVKELAADSTKYAHAIIKDGKLINILEKNVGQSLTFDQVMTMLNEVNNPGRAFNPVDKDYDLRKMRRDRDIQKDIAFRLAIARQVKKDIEK